MWENKNKKNVPYPERVALAQALVDLLAVLPAYPGAWIEPKLNSFSVHLKGLTMEAQCEVRQY